MTFDACIGVRYYAHVGRVVHLVWNSLGFIRPRYFVNGISYPGPDAAFGDPVC